LVDWQHRETAPIESPKNVNLGGTGPEADTFCTQVKTGEKKTQREEGTQVGVGLVAKRAPGGLSTKHNGRISSPPRKGNQTLLTQTQRKKTKQGPVPLVADFNTDGKTYISRRRER